MRDQEPASLQLRLHARPEFAFLLRERVRMWLEEGGAEQSEVFEVLLAVTEAFANAVEHPRDRRSRLVDVEGVISDHSVTVSIRDYGTWEDEPRRKENGGLGLVMMEHLMDAVRVECFEGGTTVTMRRTLGARVGQKTALPSTGPLSRSQGIRRAPTGKRGQPPGRGREA
jgi:anti-sigma regulatory factor (Ser/Thr protein kinase)